MGVNRIGSPRAFPTCVSSGLPKRPRSEYYGPWHDAQSLMAASASAPAVAPHQRGARRQMTTDRRIVIATLAPSDS